MHSEKYKIIGYISSIVLFGSLIFSGIFYSQLPAQIPIHFDAKGQVDDYAAKSSLWIIPLSGLFLCFGIYKLEQYLKTRNSNRTGKETIVEQKVFRILILIISLSFSYVTVQVVLTALNKSEGLGSWFLFVFVFLMIFFPLIPLIRMRVKSIK